MKSLPQGAYGTGHEAPGAGIARHNPLLHESPTSQGTPLSRQVAPSVPQRRQVPATQSRSRRQRLASVVDALHTSPSPAAVPQIPRKHRNGALHP